MKTNLLLTIVSILLLTSCTKIDAALHSFISPQITQENISQDIITSVAAATETQLFPTQTVTPTEVIASTESGCNIYNVMQKIKKEIRYKEFAIMPYSFENNNYLSIWFVDPKISVKPGDDIDQSVYKAIDSGNYLSIDLVQKVRCIAKLFTHINPIVVDSSYNGWFSGIIDIETIPITDRYVQSQYDYMISKMSLVYLRNTKPDIPPTAPEGSCSFAEVQPNILRHFDPERHLPAASYTLDESNNHIDVRWTWDYTPYDESGWWASQYASLLNVIIELPCLYPIPTILNIMVVDSNGKILLMGNIPNPNRKIDEIDFGTEFTIQYLDLGESASG